MCGCGSLSGKPDMPISMLPRRPWNNQTWPVLPLHQRLEKACSNWGFDNLLRHSSLCRGVPLKTACSQFEAKLAIRMGIVLSALTGIVPGSMKCLIETLLA